MAMICGILIGTNAFICGIIICIMRCIADAYGKTSQRLYKLGKISFDTIARIHANSITMIVDLALAIEELAQSILMGHKEDIQPGWSLGQVINVASSICLGRGPSGDHLAFIRVGAFPTQPTQALALSKLYTSFYPNPYGIANCYCLHCGFLAHHGLHSID
jgi:hypothetical protein